MDLDLERPAKVRRIYDAIASNNVLPAVLDVYGADVAPAVLVYLTGRLNGTNMRTWEKASDLYDKFGAGI